MAGGESLGQYALIRIFCAGKAGCGEGEVSAAMARHADRLRRGWSPDRRKGYRSPRPGSYRPKSVTMPPTIRVDEAQGTELLDATTSVQAPISIVPRSCRPIAAAGGNATFLSSVGE